MKKKKKITLMIVRKMMIMKTVVKIKKRMIMFKIVRKMIRVLSTVRKMKTIRKKIARTHYRLKSRLALTLVLRVPATTKSRPWTK